jgi:hypothetical protein
MKITHDSTTFRSNFDCTNFTNVTTSNQTSIWQSSTTRNIANKNDAEEEMDESDSDDNEINLERTMPPPPAPLADISQLNDTNIILTIPGAYNSSMMQSYNFNNQSNFSDKNRVSKMFHASMVNDTSMFLFSNFKYNRINRTNKIIFFLFKL